MGDKSVYNGYNANDKVTKLLYDLPVLSVVTSDRPQCW